MSGLRKTARYPRRGEVYLVRFDPVRGREIKKTRPAVVVSNNDMNELASTVIVMPITSGRHEYYLRLPISPPEGGVTKPSVIATEQVRAVDKSRVGKRLGQVDDLTMLAIEEALKLHFELP